MVRYTDSESISLYNKCKELSGLKIEVDGISFFVDIVSIVDIYKPVELEISSLDTPMEFMVEVNLSTLVNLSNADLHTEIGFKIRQKLAIDFLFQAKDYTILTKHEKAKQIKFIQYFIPLKYREEITGDLTEMIHEMQSKGINKYQINFIVYWHLFYIGYAALFFKLKEITRGTTERTEDKKEVSK